MNNMSWSYNNDTGRYVVKNARILFPNFAGVEQQYNQSGKRNFRLEVNEELADSLKSMGVYVRTMPPRDSDDETRYTVKIGVYQDADIRLLNNHNLSSALAQEEFELVDNEYRKGHIVNGNISIEFHVSKNTRVPSSSPYVRADTIILPIRKSTLLEEFDVGDDDEIPF